MLRKRSELATKRKGPHIRLELRTSDLTDLLGRQAKRLPKGQVALENSLVAFKKFAGKTDVRSTTYVCLFRSVDQHARIKVGDFIKHCFRYPQQLAAPVKFDAKIKGGADCRSP